MTWWNPHVSVDSDGRRMEELSKRFNWTMLEKTSYYRSAVRVPIGNSALTMNSQLEIHHNIIA